MKGSVHEGTNSIMLVFALILRLPHMTLDPCHMTKFNINMDQVKLDCFKMVHHVLIYHRKFRVAWAEISVRFAISPGLKVILPVTNGLKVCYWVSTSIPLSSFMHETIHVLIKVSSMLYTLNKGSPN